MFKTEYIFARILLPMIIGIVIFYFFTNQECLFLLKIITSIFFLLILAINFSYKKLNAHRFKGSTGVFMFTFFFAFGGLLCQLNNETLNENYFANKSYPCLKIWVNDEPELTNDILRFKARVVSGYKNSKQVKLSGQLLLALKLDSVNPVKLKYGDELIVSAKYLEVEPPYNPAEFNFKNWLAGQNIYEQTFINQNHLLKTQRNIGNPIIKFALGLREKQVAKYREMIKDDEALQSHQP